VGPSLALVGKTKHFPDFPAFTRRQLAQQRPRAVGPLRLVPNISRTPHNVAIVTSGLLRSMQRDEAWFAEFLKPSIITRRSSEADGILSWGLKASSQRAEAHAKRLGLPLIRMEDAFLRSVRFGTAEKPLGLVIDDLGIYYDCTKPSQLEAEIRRSLSEGEKQRCHNIQGLWQAGRVSKYNHAKEPRGRLPENYVLVVDQTAGDLSLVHGAAEANSFRQMLQAARDENPGAKILLKTHPEVVAGRKKGHFDLARLRSDHRVTLLTEDAHPVPFLENARTVYTVTSQVGFEALIWGKPVRTFGMPFYAGWGLTTDDLPPPPRRSAVTLEQLVHAALVKYARYVHPETKKRCEVEDIIAHLALQRQHIEQWPSEITALGFSRWKHRHMRRFFPYSRIRFRSRQVSNDGGTTTAVWSIPARQTAPDTSKLVTVEDGFIRSVGLGSDLVPPLSWVADLSGIYFDSSKPSDLEKLLQTAAFSVPLLARAARLRRYVLDAEITKYNWGDEQWTRPEQANGRSIILVPGQVEADASIRFGSPEMRTNFELLRQTKQNHRDAFVIYKPHPEIVAGRQSCGPDEPKCAEIADQVVTRARMGQLLSMVDEVHTMTSLAGFEGLLRGKRVTTHGQPFYAGWGLTTDFLPLERRSRRLSLDELVAGALILYPLYISQVSGRYTTPERALEELSEWHNLPTPPTNILSKLRRTISDLSRPSHPFQ
jgi:capsular polysaccharide export protein